MQILIKKTIRKKYENYIIIKVLKFKQNIYLCLHFNTIVSPKQNTKFLNMASNFPYLTKGMFIFATQA